MVSVCAILESREGWGLAVVERGKGRGSHQNHKPQACVGETRGVQEGLGAGGKE